MRSRTKPYVLLSPAFALLILLAASLGLLVIYSFYRYNDGGGMTPALTLENYRHIVEETLYLRVIANTVGFGVLVTVLNVLLGYPLAYYLRGLSPRWRVIGFLLIVAPLWTSVIVRTYGWAILLGPQGPLNVVLREAFSPQAMLLIYPGFWAVVIGLLQISLPLMVIPIFTSLRSLDPAIEEASRTLGGGSWYTFRRVTLPLSLPGVFAGVLLTFMLVVGAYVTPVLLGSPRDLVLPVVIEDQVNSLYNIPFASSLALVMLVLVSIVILVFRRSVRLDQLFGQS